MKMMSKKTAALMATLGLSLAISTSMNASTSDDLIIKNISMYSGQICLAGDANCDANMASASDTATEATETAVVEVAAAGRSGEEIYNKSCLACHMTGVAGAPKIGDGQMKARFDEKGMDGLLATSISGINAMPPKGTCFDCSDDELKAAIQYMVDSD